MRLKPDFRTGRRGGFGKTGQLARIFGGMMKKYICDVCGYIYDPEVGDPDNDIAPGTSFEKIPEDWVCPLCGVGKDDFSVYED